MKCLKEFYRVAGNKRAPNGIMTKARVVWPINVNSARVHCTACVRMCERDQYMGTQGHSVTHTPADTMAFISTYIRKTGHFEFVKKRN